VRCAALLALIAVCACAGAQPALPVRAHRMVSLMPSFTEDLCAVGARGEIVAVSKYSQDIACAAGLPVVSDYAAVDTERVVALRSDLVVGIPAQSALVSPLRRLRIPVLLLPNDSFASIFTNIARLGSLTGHERNASRLIGGLKARTARLVASERFSRRPSVFFVVQALPLWTTGRSSYITSLLKLAGATNAVQAAQAYLQYSAEALLARQPDAIVAASDAGLAGVLNREPWRSLRAVRAHRVYILGNAALIVRPGPRYNEGLSWLIDRLRPLAT